MNELVDRMSVKFALALERGTAQRAKRASNEEVASDSEDRCNQGLAR